MAGRAKACGGPAVAGEPLPEYRADYLWAQAIAAGDADARRRFSREYGEKILQTVYLWCKPFCSLDCKLRRAGVRRLMQHFLRQECEQVLDAYSYLLDQLMNVVLKRYRGRRRSAVFFFPSCIPMARSFTSIGSSLSGRKRARSSFLGGRKV